MSHMESFLEAMSTNGEGEGGSCGRAETLFEDSQKALEMRLTSKKTVEALEKPR